MLLSFAHQAVCKKKVHVVEPTSNRRQVGGFKYQFNPQEPQRFVAQMSCAGWAAKCLGRTSGVLGVHMLPIACSFCICV